MHCMHCMLGTVKQRAITRLLAPCLMLVCESGHDDLQAKAAFETQSCRRKQGDDKRCDGKMDGKIGQRR